MINATPTEALRAAVEAATNKARAASFQFDLARERLAAAELAKTRADADLREAKYRLEQAERGSNA